ncbi:hypothetical protein D3C81_2181950 [compost metagenome]
MLDRLLIIGNDFGNRVQAAYMRKGLVSELGAIGQDDGLIRRGDHRLLDRNFHRVDIGDATFRMHAFSPEERPVRVDVLEFLHGVGPD